MATSIRDTPGANCIAIEPTGLAHPIWGIIIAMLLALMLLDSDVNKNDLMPNETSLQAVATQSVPHLNQEAPELIPVFTGGLGASTSLGGNSSLGGGSH